MKHVELAKGDWAIDPKKFVAAIQIVHQISMESMAGEMQDAMLRLRATAIDDPTKQADHAEITAIPSTLLSEQKYRAPAKALSRLVSFQFDMR